MFKLDQKANPLKINGLNVDSPACKSDIPAGIISPAGPFCQGRFQFIFLKLKEVCRGLINFVTFWMVLFDFWALVKKN